MTDEQSLISALVATVKTEALITQLQMITAIEEEPLIALCDALTVRGINPDGALESLLRLVYAGFSTQELKSVITEAATWPNEDSLS